jgi:hypothetical protein
MQQADEIVQDRHHRLACGLRIAMGDLHRSLLVLAQQHGRTVAAVVDDGVVETAIARAGIDRSVWQVVGVQQIDDDVRGPSACPELCRRVVRHYATRSAMHFSGLSWTYIASPTLVRRVGWRRESSVRAPTFT